MPTRNNITLVLKSVTKALFGLFQGTGLLPRSIYTTNEIQDIDTISLRCGTFADIYSATYQGQRVVLKRIRIFQNDTAEQPDRAYKALHREAMVWRQLNHPHILPMHGIDSLSFRHMPCIVLPWMENGDFYHAVQKIPAEELKNLLARWVFEICQGVAYLHAEKIVHGDLRGPNILIDKDLHVKLTDFGLSNPSDNQYPSILSSLTLNPRWAAPELLRPADTTPIPDTRSDVYSFGCLCIELYTQQKPYYYIKDEYCVRDAVLNHKWPDPPTGRTPMPEEIWELCTRCWNAESDVRPTMSDIMRDLADWRTLENC